MNPPIRDARHRDGAVAGGRQRARRRARLRPRAAHARGEGPALSRLALGHAGRADAAAADADHVAAGRLTLERFVDLTSDGARAHLRHRRQGPHRASATTPTSPSSISRPAAAHREHLAWPAAAAGRRSTAWTVDGLAHGDRHPRQGRDARRRDRHALQRSGRSIRGGNADLDQLLERDAFRSNRQPSGKWAVRAEISRSSRLLKKGSRAVLA